MFDAVSGASGQAGEWACEASGTSEACGRGVTRECHADDVSSRTGHAGRDTTASTGLNLNFNFITFIF